MGEKTYEVVRFYQNNRKPRVQKRGLSLKEAQKHCSDPETSSQTAKQPRGCGDNGRSIQKWHDLQKHWFDGYREEK